MVEMLETGKLPLSLKQIEEVQKYFGVVLPADYVEFMLQFNGGLPYANAFDCENGRSSFFDLLYQ